MDRRLFSKIRSDKDYRPSKNTVLALIISLELNGWEAIELLESAGYALSPSIREDVIVMYFIENRQYDISMVNDVLDYYGFHILGERKNRT